MADLEQKIKVKEAAEWICGSFKKGGKILICGNGGSFSEAQHFAGELVGRFKLERAGLPALVLGSNTAALTAIGNDYNFEIIFARELEAFGKSGDILVALSTSGNSKNIISAVELAKKLGIKTIGLLGAGGALQSLVDLAISVQSTETPRIQEAHLVIIHAISEAVENLMFKNK